MKETRLAELWDSNMLFINNTNSLNTWFDIAWEQAGVITDLFRDVFRPEQIKTSVLAQLRWRKFKVLNFLIAVEHSLRRGLLSWQKNTAVCHQQRNPRKCLWSCLTECPGVCKGKKTAPRIEPWGTPHVRGADEDKQVSMMGTIWTRNTNPFHDYWCQRLQISQAELKQNDHFCLNAQE